MTAAARIRPAPHDHACGHCKGTGRKQLRPWMREVLDAMSRDVEHVASDIARATGRNLTTTLERLKRLRSLGLVRRRDQRGASMVLHFWWRA
jgi:predicted transcriptional regulator